MTEERFEFTAKAKRSLAITLIVGLVLVAIGVFSVMSDGGHVEEAGHGAIIELADQTLADASMSSNAVAAEEGESHGSAPWLKRLFANLWINNIYFTGIAVIGLFFFALQYATSAGWSAPFLRVPLAMGSWLPIAFLLMIGVFLLASGDLFHWTHHDLIDPTSANYDALIAGKSGYLNVGFYIGRMVVFFGGWYLFFVTFRKHALAEDLEGGPTRWSKMRGLAAWFLIFFGVSSSMSAWDWVMSIDPHWFSTMFGWYVFSSWWVSGLAAITLIVIVLKDKGYLAMVNRITFTI